MLRGTRSLDKRGLKSKKRLNKRLATVVLQLLQLVPHISETFLSELQRCLPWGADDLLIWRGAAWLSLKARGTVGAPRRTLALSKSILKVCLTGFYFFCYCHCHCHYHYHCHCTTATYSSVKRLKVYRKYGFRRTPASRHRLAR